MVCVTKIQNILEKTPKIAPQSPAVQFPPFTECSELEVPPSLTPEIPHSLTPLWNHPCTSPGPSLSCALTPNGRPGESLPGHGTLGLGMGPGTCPAELVKPGIPAAGRDGDPWNSSSLENQ